MKLKMADVQVYTFLFSLLLLVTFGNSTSDLTKQVRTISEGANCRCRCVLKTESGEPCEGNPARRRILFYVDTIANGSDCRCSCIAPTPPDNCQVDMPRSEETGTRESEGVKVTIPIAEDIMGSTVSMTLTEASHPRRTLQEVATSESLEGALDSAVTRLNMLKMYSSVANMVLAIKDLEKSLSINFTDKTASLREDILKVAAALQNADDYRNQTLNETENEVERYNYTSTVGLTNLTDQAAANETAGHHNITIGKHSGGVKGVNVSFSGSNEYGSTLANKQILHSQNASNEEIITRFEVTANGTLPSLREVSEGSSNVSKKVTDIASTEATAVNANSSQRAVENKTFDPTTSTEKQKRFNITSTTHAGNPASKNSDIIRPPIMPVHQAKPDQPEPVTTKGPSAVNTTTSQPRTESENSEDTTTIAVSTTRSTTSTPAPTRQKAGMVELYRNNGLDGSDTKQKGGVTSSKDYYDDDYYDDAETRNDSLTLHPPLVSGGPPARDDDFDVSAGQGSTPAATTSSRATAEPSSTITTTTTTTTSTPTTTGRRTHTTTPGKAAGSSYDINEYYGSNEDRYDDDPDYYESYDDEITTTTTAATVTTQTTTTSPGCGTLLNLSNPRSVHDFGRREGAWMQDPVAKSKNRNKIYVTNFYYGNNLIEFETMSNFKNFRWSNSYMLPYNWIGTGHIVYNGSFYYNRAFSRVLVKYELKYRFATAWGHLRNAVYDSSTPFTWRGHTMVHMAADESGLWVMYPAYSDFDSYSNVGSYVINKINPTDLQTISTWRTTLRRHAVSHLFVVCGVVYATDRYNSYKGRITHAYDTHTGVKRTLNLPYVNKYAYNVQLLYHAKERKLMSWDNGHQVIYDVNMTY